MYLIADLQRLVKNGPVVTEKSKFQFSNVNDLGPRSRNDLDLQYSHIFIKSISLRSYAGIVSDIEYEGRMPEQGCPSVAFSHFFAN